MGVRIVAAKSVTGATIDLACGSGAEAPGLGGTVDIRIRSYDRPGASNARRTTGVVRYAIGGNPGHVPRAELVAVLIAGASTIC